MNIQSKLVLAAIALLMTTAHSYAGLQNESEVGVIVTTGNTRSQNYNVRQQSNYTWEENLLRFTGRFFKSSSKGAEIAKNWSLGLRYERELSERWAAFIGQNLESDAYAGYLQRYNTDLGGKYSIYKLTDFNWFTEAGYRYTSEHRRTSTVNSHSLRLYTEATRKWNASVSSTLWIEYLPNLTTSADYQLNSELSLASALSETFSVKMAYLVKHRGILAGTATEKTDSQLTAALIAKF
jgi:putative salt-induced outer membrane protein YdiY